MVITGYKYTTKAKAQADADKLTDYYLKDAHESCTTTEWCSVMTGDGFYYIVADASMLEVLGVPTQIQIEEKL